MAVVHPVPIFIMRLRGLVLFKFFLPSAAHRMMQTDDSHHEKQQQSNTLINTLKVSVEAREAFLPGRFVNVLLRGRRPQTGAFHAAHGQGPQLTAPQGQPRSMQHGGLGAWRVLGPRCARVALQVASARAEDLVAKKHAPHPLRVSQSQHFQQEVLESAAKKRGKPQMNADWKSTRRPRRTHKRRRTTAEEALEDLQALVGAAVKLARALHGETGKVMGAAQAVKSMETMEAMEAATAEAAGAAVAVAQASEAADALGWAAVKLRMALSDGTPEAFAEASEAARIVEATEAALDNVVEAAVVAAEAWEDAQALAESALQLSRVVFGGPVKATAVAQVVEATEAVQTVEAMEAALAEVSEAFEVVARASKEAQAPAKLAVQLAKALSGGTARATGAVQAAKTAEAAESAVPAEGAEVVEAAAQASEAAGALVEAAVEFSIALSSGSPDALGDAIIALWRDVCDDHGCLSGALWRACKDVV